MTSRSPRLPRLSLWPLTSAVTGLWVAATLLLAAALPAAAGLGVWTPLGPDSASVSAILEHPADPATVFAGTDQGGLFRSADGGLTWTASSLGLGIAGSFPGIVALAADRRSPGLLYLGTSSSGLFRSTDGGRSWLLSSHGLEALPFGLRVRALLVDPAVRRTVYAGTGSGVFRSTDGGATWAPWRDGLPEGRVNGLVFDVKERFLYAALQSGGVYRTDRGGRGPRWQPFNTGLPATVLGLALDPRAPSTFLAGSTHGLYRTTDGGRSWTPVGFGVVHGIVFGVGFQAATGTLYAADNLGIYRSADGTAWSGTGGIPSDAGFQTFSVGAGRLYLGTRGYQMPGGVFRSADGGATWQLGSRGLSTLRVDGFAGGADPAPRALYAGGAPGLFQSTDEGATWRRLPLQPPTAPQSVSMVFVDPAAPQTVFAGAGFLLRSDDGGATWAALPPDSRLSFYAMASDPRGAGALWGGGFGTAQHSADGGATWQTFQVTATEYPWIYDIAVDPRDPRRIYYGGAAIEGARAPLQHPRIFRSVDGGASWQTLMPDPAANDWVNQVALDPLSSGVLYAASSAALFRSDDDGATWHQILDLGTLPGAVLATPEALYAARWAAGVLRSTDRGATWTPMRNGLGARPVTRLWADPADSRHLFAATQNGGLYTFTVPAEP